VEGYLVNQSEIARQNLRQKRIWILKVFFIFAMSSTLILSIIQASQRIYQIESWIPVDGESVDTTIIKKRDLTQSKTSVEYSAKWIFNYEVGTRKLQSVAEAGYTTSDVARVKYWETRFHRGTHYKIRYNPNTINSISVFGWDFDTFWYPGWLLGWSLLISIVYFLIRRFLK